MCRTGLFVIALSVGAFIFGAGCTSDPAKDLAGILVSGQWVKDHGAPPLQDQHVYTFSKDGSYSYNLVTDHSVPTVTGRWEIAVRKDGKVLLRLKDQEGQENYGGAGLSVAGSG